MSKEVRLLAVLVLLTGLLAGVAPMASAGGPWYVSTTGDDGNDCQSWAAACRTIQAAVNKAGAGDTIYVAAGTDTLTSTVSVNKANLQIVGAGSSSTILQVSAATGYVFSITADGVTVRDLQIYKTDKSGPHNLIYIGADNVTIRDNIIRGQYVLGDPDVSRAMEVAYGSTGLTIQGNTIHSLRQPAYINGSTASPTTGTIANNHVYGTRGWVIAGANMTFTGNTWGSGAQANYLDIVILAGTDPSYYPDIVAVSEANNNAVVEDQRVSPAVLSDVFVDDSAAAGGDGTVTRPYQTIGAGITRAVAGGTVHVAAGTYNESQILITKALTVQGAGIDQSIVDGDSYAGLPAEGLVRIVTTGDVTFTGFTLREAGATGGSKPVRVGIFARSSAPGNTFTITYNKILGSNNPDDEEDYGFYAHTSYASLVFQHNIVTQTGANAILLERHFGPTDVSYNTLDAGCWGTDVIFNMTYDGDVTTPQIVHANTFDMGTGGPFDYAHRAAAVTFASAFTGAAGKFTNVQITDNIITNLKSYRRGPGLWNNSGGDGSGGDTTGAVISGNIITGTGAANSDGIQIVGKASNTVIENNKVTNVDRSFRGRVWNGHVATGTVLRNNSFSGNTTGLVWEGTSTLDAELNWWGHASGPYHPTLNPSGTGDPVSDNVDFDPWLGTKPLWQLVEEASPGDTIILGAGTYPGGVVIDKPLTLVGVDGTVIGPGSDGITVSANDVTIDSITLDGTGGDPGDVGIRVLNDVERLWVRNCEIRDWPDDGIHFNGAITGLKVVDNYIHDNGGDGMEFNATPAGTVQIYGNALRANTGYGVNAVSGSVVAEYNEWGHIDGPASGDGVSGSVDYDPWVFGAVYADVVPDPARVREGENVDVDIKVDTANLYGAQFSLTFDPAKLKVVSTTDSGAGYFKGSQECSTTYNNTLGTLTFHCSRGGTDTAVSGSGVKLLTITFQAQEITGTSTTATIDLDASKVRLGALGGVNIYVDSVTDDTLTILGTTTVSGVVDLQGRDNDSGAVVDPLAGVTYGYDPSPVTTGPWGTYSFSNMTDDTYTFKIEMARYLDASAVVVVSGDTMTLNKAILLGGDVNDSDEIDITDLSSIGGKFGETVNPATTPQDINYDGLVDILDLVLAAGNYGLTSSPWTP